MSDLDPWGNPIGNVSKSDLANQINSNLIQLNAHMNKLEEYYNTLGTQKENSTIRAEITRLRLVCRDLIKQTKDHFAQMENNEKKEQLLKNFNDFLYKYEQLSQKAMRRETEILQVMESSARGDKEQAERKSKQLQIQLIEIVDDGVILQRNEDLKKLEEDLKELKDVVEEFSAKVKEDGQRLTNASKNVENVQNNIQAGVQNQQEASKAACCARKQKLVIALIIIAIVVIIVLVVVLSIVLRIN